MTNASRWWHAEVWTTTSRSQNWGPLARTIAWSTVLNRRVTTTTAKSVILTLYTWSLVLASKIFSRAASRSFTATIRRAVDCMITMATGRLQSFIQQTGSTITLAIRWKENAKVCSSTDKRVQQCLYHSGPTLSSVNNMLPKSGAHSQIGEARPQPVEINPNFPRPPPLPKINPVPPSSSSSAISLPVANGEVESQGQFEVSPECCNTVYPRDVDSNGRRCCCCSAQSSQSDCCRSSAAPVVSPVTPPISLPAPLVDCAVYSYFVIIGQELALPQASNGSSLTGVVVLVDIEQPQCSRLCSDNKVKLLYFNLKNIDKL